MSRSEILTPGGLAPLLLAALDAGRSAAVLSALTHPRAGGVGSRILVTESETRGTFQDSQADGAAEKLARGALKDPAATPGRHTLPLEGGGVMEVFLDLHHPQPEMVIVGAGHLAQPLCTLGALLGLQVRVLDDRPRFATRERFPEALEVRQVDFADAFAGLAIHPWSHVVLVTRGHRYDYECLRQILLLPAQPGYLGMIGSRRRVRATFEALMREGVPRDALRRVHAPIGLDLGGETPAEIAVAVAAEIVHHWRGGSAVPLSRKEAVLDRLLPEGGGEDEGRSE